ncbi:MAG: hypothetical protein JXR51_04440 [Bacteroidales bacterium]|nr:hypothetical protein [Bacteroidales bacterium]MBN2756405.1 hypothetical protein [Bacteroidales bacterium]
MKKLLKFAILLAIIPMLSISSCKKDNTTEPVERQTDPEFQTLTTYMAANSMDLSAVVTDWITSASAVAGSEANYYIIDLRSADAYNAGHITGAVNSTLANVITTAANNGGKPILVACYTGQTAGHAVCALRLSGYPTAKVLMWGMSGWNSSLSASWTGGTGDVALSSANWTDAPGAIVDNVEFDDPDLTTTATTGATMLAERVAAMLNTGFQGITATDVLANPAGFFINNYWAEADVETYGNITGAHRINPLTIAGGEYKYLDPEQTIVTYCWTGQTSSVITAYLNVIGYTASSLKFGANSMIYSDLTAHKWDATTVVDNTLVTK